METGCASRWILAALLLAFPSSGCRSPTWVVGENVRARDADVAAALGDTGEANTSGLAASDVPEIPYPRALRPCCAFGADLNVALGRVPVPGVELGNLVDPAALGHHRYDNGFVSMQGGDPRGVIGVEGNGLVYTCRGGFVDLAHVRDNADNTLALSAAVARQLETGGSIDVPPQGATLQIRLRPVSSEAVARYGRVTLAVAEAQWLAFQLSIWHEIATFYGYASIAQWPEKISAFSPEDLYSNQLGVRISGGLILAKQARSNVDYDLAMDAWVARALSRLGAVSEADSLTAMQRVDGRWWDSAKRIPDWTLVKRRDFVTGPFLRGWRLEDATPGPVEPLASCRDAGLPLRLQVPDGFAGARFTDYATLEILVGDTLVQGGFPLPREGSRLVTQEDFPAIIAAIRQANEATFGPGADGP